MSRKISFLIAIVVIFISSIEGIECRAEGKYIGKNPPSNYMINKSFSYEYKRGWNDNVSKINEIIGKRKPSENIYQVFYTYTNNEGKTSDIQNNIQLIMLDTNIWLFEICYPTFCNRHIMQE